MKQLSKRDSAIWLHIKDHICWGTSVTGNPWPVLAWLFNLSLVMVGTKSKEKTRLEDKGAVVYGHYGDNGDYEIAGWLPLRKCTQKSSYWKP